MADVTWNVGTIQQINGPLPSNSSAIIGGASNTSYKLGISIDEDDFMSWNANHGTLPNDHYDKDFKFKINNEQIHLGRTCMYETQYSINNTKLQFPDGAPASLKIQIVHCAVNS